MSDYSGPERRDAGDLAGAVVSLDENVTALTAEATAVRTQQRQLWIALAGLVFLLLLVGSGVLTLWAYAADNRTIVRSVVSTEARAAYAQAQAAVQCDLKSWVSEATGYPPPPCTTTTVPPAP